MDTAPDITPLALQREGNHLRFTFAPPEEILPELPADYERLLGEQLRTLLQDSAPLTAEVDLHDTPALSSRQLGALIALQRVLRRRFNRVRLTHVSDAIRQLLTKSRVNELYEIG